MLPTLRHPADRLGPYSKDSSAVAPSARPRRGHRRSGGAIRGIRLVSLGLVSLWVSGCGARSGLLDDVEESVEDGGPSQVRDTGVLDSFVSPADVRSDTRMPRVDSADTRVVIDARDAPLPDVPLPGCGYDGTELVIYLLTAQAQLGTFDPVANTFRLIGTLNCPGAFLSSPFSMAVDRRGVAYVGYDSGALYRVSTKDASCSATDFRNQTIPDGFTTFGMAFTTEPDLSEALYVASTGEDGRLARVDPSDLRFSLIGSFSPTVQDAELTGSGAGRLFAFYRDWTTAGSSIVAQVDAQTAAVSNQVRLRGVLPQVGWAFAYWGGSFYLFAAPTEQGSEVFRYRPDAAQYERLAVLDQVVVGAGVSTCAPSQ